MPPHKSGSQLAPKGGIADLKALEGFGGDEMVLIPRSGRLGQKEGQDDLYIM